jgi:Uma2 family endonuclease
MKIDIDRPPRTAMEVFRLLPEGTLCEVIENQLYMAPPPNEPHQRILVSLILELGNFIKQNDLGEIRLSPYGVYLNQENAVEPDIVFISKENTHLILKDGLHGAPDLIIEILSPSNKKYDTITKKLLYEKFGVKEYWIVNPENKEVIGFELMQGKYTEFSKATGKLNSKLLDHIFSF